MPCTVLDLTGFSRRCRIEVLFSYNYIEERFAMLYFENDYCEGAHPAILQKLTENWLILRA